MKKILLSTILISSLLACQSTQKPAFDLTNAKKEIEAANVEISAFMAKGDTVGIASAYSKEGSLMPNNMPSVKGKDSLVAIWSEFIKAGIGSIELNTLEVWGDQNFITEEGLFEIKTKEGVALDKGKYLVLWKKEDGKWKLHRDISNSNLPLVSK
jgi:ketosteroid isomerase-like protein